MIHINPVSHALGQLAPPFTIVVNMVINQRTGLGIEEFLSILFNLGLVFQAEFLLDGYFYRKAMGIPACLARHTVSLHGPVTAHGIFDGTAEDMMNPRFTIDSWWPFIKGKNPVGRFFLQAFMKDSALIPVREHFSLNLTVRDILWILGKFISMVMKIIRGQCTGKRQKKINIRESAVKTVQAGPSPLRKRPA